MDKLTFTILLHELAGALKRLSSHDSYDRDEYVFETRVACDALARDYIVT